MNLHKLHLAIICGSLGCGFLLVIINTYSKYRENKQKLRDNMLLALQELSYDEMKIILMKYIHTFHILDSYGNIFLTKNTMDTFSPIPLGVTIGSLLNQMNQKEREINIGAIILALVDYCCCRKIGSYDKSREFCKAMESRHSLFPDGYVKNRFETSWSKKLDILREAEANIKRSNNKQAILKTVIKGLETFGLKPEPDDLLK